MCLIACTLWPPHSVPAFSSSPFAVCKLCSGRSTSAGLSFWNGAENRVGEGTIIITENSTAPARVPSPFRYLRKNAKTPVSIRNKDITPTIISSRSSLRKSGSIKWSLRMDPTLSAFPILSQLARKHDPVIPSIRGPQRWRIQGETARLSFVDEGRKRVLLIAASILAARKLANSAAKHKFLPH